MVTGLNLSITLFVIVVLFFIMDFYFIRRFDRQRADGRKGWSWDYTLFTIGLGVIVILQPMIFPRIGIYTFAAWGWGIQLFGIILVLISFVLHIWAREHLKKFYTERVEVQPDHKLVDTGPYALMRHPIITSFFALVLGILFINPALTSLAVTAYAFWDFLRAARQEETVLGKEVPGYIAYTQRVPRFLPRLQRRS